MAATLCSGDIVLIGHEAMRVVSLSMGLGVVRVKFVKDSAPLGSVPEKYTTGRYLLDQLVQTYARYP